jgi:hypothetical protein
MCRVYTQDRIKFSTSECLLPPFFKTSLNKTDQKTSSPLSQCLDYPHRQSAGEVAGRNRVSQLIICKSFPGNRMNEDHLSLPFIFKVWNGVINIS